MKPLNTHLIEYFEKNELALENTLFDNSVTYGGFPSARYGLRAYQVYTPNGDVMFTPSDFKIWQRFKDYYNSPLYKALNEEQNGNITNTEKD